MEPPFGSTCDPADKVGRSRAPVNSIVLKLHIRLDSLQNAAIIPA
jgi:hypothetical protein